MTSPSQSARRDDAVAEASADWVCRIQSGDINPDNCDELKAWLAGDERHRVAFRRMLDVLDATKSLRTIRSGPSAVKRSRTGTAPWLLAAAASTVFAAGLAVSLLFAGEDFQTATGERRLIHLDDGSSAHMNVRSDLTVRLDRKSRVVELREGEVLFDVAGTDPRPFIVETDAFDVVVTGTSFQVTRYNSGVAVSVLEGSVDVRLGADGAGRADTDGPITLAAGEGIRLEADGLRHLTGLDPRRIAGWRDGWLYLDNATVGELVERLNRQYDGDVHADVQQHDVQEHWQHQQ